MTNAKENAPEEAPFPLTAIDRELLSMTDEQFRPISWSMLQSYVANNELEELKRYPSQLRLYMSWTSDIQAKYGSVTNFILRERVKWVPLPSSDPGAAPKFDCRGNRPFEHPQDYKVLVNDWPYGFEKGITHVVVWSKIPIPADLETGGVTAEGAAIIEEFVQRHFVAPLRAKGILGPSEDRKRAVLWFKNFIRLQSVRAVEHAHVLLKGADADLLRDLCSQTVA